MTRPVAAPRSFEMLHPTWTLIIVVILAVLLFSRPGKLSGLMEDLG